MLLPSVHWLLSWYTLVPGSLEWNGFTFTMGLPSRVVRRAAKPGHTNGSAPKATGQRGFLPDGYVLRARVGPPPAKPKTFRGAARYFLPTMAMLG